MEFPQGLGRRSLRGQGRQILGCTRREALSVQWRWRFGSSRDLGQMDIWIPKEGVPWGLRGGGIE